MSILTVTNLKKIFGTEIILNGLTTALERGEKVALVGPNGVGKSTFLKILAGQIIEDGGTIIYPEGVTTAYLPQTIDQYHNLKIKDYVSQTINQSEWPYTIKIILSGLGLGKIDYDRPVGTLSSGEQGKLALAVTLLTPADILLLDEPTNNLDLPTIIWLTEYLKISKAAAIIISHDRAFLDGLVREVWSIDQLTRKITVQKGNYSQYLDNEIRKIKEAERLYLNQEIKVAQLRVDVARNYARMRAGQKWVGNDNDKLLRGYYRNKAGKSGRRAEVVSKRIERISIHSQPTVKEPIQIGFTNHDQVAALTFSETRYFKTPVNLGPLTWKINPGEKILIIGENGAGKSTLLKLANDELKPTGGLISRDENLITAQLTQLQQNLSTTDTPISHFKTMSGLSSSESIDYLKTMRLSETDLKRPIKLLSPGTKMKLVIADLTIQQINCLILDEPTSHLDLDANVALIDGLNNYTGSLITVSHDLAFIKSLKIDRVFLLENGLLTQIKSLDHYLETATQKAKKLLRIIKA